MEIDVTAEIVIEADSDETESFRLLETWFDSHSKDGMTAKDVATISRLENDEIEINVNEHIKIWIPIWQLEKALKMTEVEKE